ncbi:unnamed protein product [Ceratitis capitata]|uniref:(Mediterranean fruit fly) hypothetical protein n=1 Tax=Ceratitis capitata TaxID=7213 RepID=A0A811V4S6_CERCA|nr:unnamed protein product [Ceratitis capitata]
MHQMLFNFIINHFLNANIYTLLVFNCWDWQVQRQFLHKLNERSLYTRFVHIETADFSGILKVTTCDMVDLIWERT